MAELFSAESRSTSAISKSHKHVFNIFVLSGKLNIFQIYLFGKHINGFMFIITLKEYRKTFVKIGKQDLSFILLIIRILNDNWKTF